MRSCASCHGPTGKGGARPGYKVAPADLTSPELHQRLGEAGLKRTIVEGKGQMPPFGKMLTDEQLADLLLYLSELRQ